MRRGIFFSIVFILCILFTNCERDNITNKVPSGNIVVDDDFEEDKYSKVVKIVFSSSGDALVTGRDESFSVAVVGNGVTIQYSGTENVLYEVSGSTNNGFLKIYSSTEQAIRLTDATIFNPNGAAINIQGSITNPSKGNLTHIVFRGNNFLEDGRYYTNTPTGEDEKAVIFSEGQLIFWGSGTLKIDAQGKSGINSDGSVQINNSGVLTITSTAGHGIRGAEYILLSRGTNTIKTMADTKKGLSTDGLLQIDGGETTITVSGNAAYDNEDLNYSGTAGVKTKGDFVINGGILTITNTGIGGKGINGDGSATFKGGLVSITTSGATYTAGDVSSKAIKFQGNIQFLGAEVNVECQTNEAIESKSAITVAGGTIYSYSANDDAVNSGGDFTINDGVFCAHSAKADGIDANGNCYIKGGVVYAIGGKSPEVAIDANTEAGYKLYIQGGTIVAIGGLEKNASLTQSCYSTNSWSKNSWYALTVGSKTYTFRTPSNGGNTLVISGATSPALKSGVTISGGTNICNDMLNLTAAVSGGTAVSLTTYTGNNGGHPGGWK